MNKNFKSPVPVVPFDNDTFKKIFTSTTPIDHLAFHDIFQPKDSIDDSLLANILAPKDPIDDSLLANILAPKNPFDQTTFDKIFYNNSKTSLVPLKKNCKCGSNSHQRTSHNNCRLNNKLTKNTQANQMDSIEDYIDSIDPSIRILTQTR